MVAKVKKNTIGVPTPELAQAHKISVMTLITAMLLFFICHYNGYAQKYMVYIWLACSAVAVVILYINLFKEYKGKYLVRTSITMLISGFAGFFSHNLLVKLKVGDLDLIVTLTMLALLVWGIVVSLLFLLRKKWLYYTLNVFNFLLLVIPTIIVIMGAYEKSTPMLGIGIISVYPTGLLFVYALNRFNSEVDDILLCYTFAAFIELGLLILIGLSLLTEDGSFLDVFSGVTPIDGPIGSAGTEIKKVKRRRRGKEVSI